jgi:hypothetical protein
MNFTHMRLDMEQMLARPTPPVDRLPRGPGETWLIVGSPVTDFEAQIDWRRSIRGDVVPIPLIPYAMPVELDIALAFMVQIGVRLASTVDGTIARLHLSIGTPVAEEQLPDNGGPYWKYWLGFAVLLQK